MSRPEVFISYAPAERPLARGLAFALERRGYRVAPETDVARPGQSLGDHILARLRGAQTVVALLSPAALKSDFVALETGFAEARARDDERFVFRPFWIAGASPRSAPPGLRSLVGEHFAGMPDPERLADVVDAAALAVHSR